MEFKGKIFFLDIHDSTLREKLIWNISLIGGTVVFDELTPKVLFLITDSATHQSEKSSSLIQTAKGLNIKIYAGEQFNQLLENKIIYSKRKTPNIIVVEDSTKIHRPSFREFKEDSIPLSSHFVSATSKPRNPVFSLEFLEQRAKENQALQQKKRRKKKKQKYCEICGEYYSNLHSHIVLKMHRNFAKKKKNYQQIDQLFKNIRKQEKKK
ncbi:activator of s-phase kinase-related [Anaeramoeba ignava]|uniref:Activator of s-phase kinase-related n=1 Tax=Anaeramoeba ignava TaxID=1746090 RepID=A0A9Q0L619_ANAIG|nr:activator of s-phase kinase-related [Anaeramoeba ignava]|eukprot:Anaeramoba_ignava/a1716_62.p1 GENE.a1716_62~~a1716_62.p1  ORF type:complete len:210 (+),score=62.50 a1716_62:13-642(+)